MKKIIDPNQYFYLHNGGAIRDLSELHSALLNMDDSIFYYHVNQEKNDFSNWIKDILEEKNLALQLKKTIDKNTTITLIEKKINTHNKIKNKPSKTSILGQIKGVFHHG